MEEFNEKEPSMLWWDFYKYVRFPVGIITRIVYIMVFYYNSTFNGIMFFALFLDIFLGIFLIITYYHFWHKTKIGYKLINILLIIELINSSLNASIDNKSSFFAILCILGLIWTLPNYIYFEKRKRFFSNDKYSKNNEPNTKNNQSDDMDLKILLNKLEKSQNTDTVGSYDNNIDEFQGNSIEKYDISTNEIQNTSLENAEEVGDKNNTSNNSERGNKIYNIVFSTLVIIAIIGACFLGYLMYEEYQDTISNYEEQIDKLHSTVSNKNQEVSKYTEKINAMNSQISFMDSHVAICPNDGTGLYHKYNCEHLDLSSYFVYNTEQALSKGYKACQYCSNSSNTYTSYDRFKENVEQDEIVYITDTGSNYHKESCSYLKSKNAITKEKAQNEGYTACSRCRP